MLQETPRPIELEDNESYSLVTVKRRYGGVIPREILKGEEIKVKTYFVVKANDFLISKRQIVHDACGVVPKDLDGAVVSNEYSVLRAKEGCSIEFLNYFSQQPCVSDSFLQSSVGIVIEKMLFKLNTWLRHEFYIPSYAEQQKIADCLSSLDELIAAEGRKLESLRSYKKSLMQQLFPRDGEATPRLRFPEFRGNGEWVPHKFGDFVVKSFYGTSKSTSATGQYPVLRMGNMGDGRLDFTNLVYIDMARDDFEDIRLRRGDILLNRTNSRDLVGKVSVFDRDDECMTASYIVSFRLDGERIDPWFCNQMLNAQMYQSRIRLLATPSISQANINPTSFRTGLDIAVPVLTEQQRIAGCFSSLDNQITAQCAKFDALRAHKKGLMQRLFPSEGGEIDHGR